MDSNLKVEKNTFGFVQKQVSKVLFTQLFAFHVTQLAISDI